MSEDSWLFLFAAIGAVGGFAQIAQLYFQVRPPGSSAETGARDGGDGMNSVKASGVFVSSTRLIIMALVMTLSGGLAIWGLVRSLRGPEPPKSAAIGVINCGAWGAKRDPKTRLPESVFIDVQTISTGPKAKTYNLIAISRASYDRVDGMKDELIDKSAIFSLGVGVRRIETQLSPESVKRISVGHVIDMWVVALPVEFSPQQITTLASLDQLKAVILFQRTIGVPDK